MEQISPRLLDFDQNRTPSAPRHAATVVVLRDGNCGLEVFCVRRHSRSSFLGGALVFPGGKVDAADGDDGWAEQVTPHAARAADFGGEDVTARALCIAACRELLEEGSILPVDRPLLDAPAEVDAIKREALAGEPLWRILARRGLRLALGELVPWARWITPEAESRRFDARFFLLPLPAGQVGRHDGHETTTSFWAAPREVLDRAERGEFFLAPPTLWTLDLLTDVADVRTAVALASRQSLLPICPRFVPGEGDAPPYLALPGDPAHEIRERRAEGPTRYVLRDGRFCADGDKRRGSPTNDARERERGSSKHIERGSASGSLSDAEQGRPSVSPSTMNQDREQPSPQAPAERRREPPPYPAKPDLEE